MPPKSNSGKDGRPGTWTSTPPGGRSWASWLASLSEDERQGFVEGLSDEAAAALRWTFEVWRLAGHQAPPPGRWRSWVILGGRGAGKTRAGAEWVRALVEGGTPLAPGARSRVALVGETFDQVREVMIEGPSGIRACSPPDRRPEWIATRRLLRWQNGAEALAFSAGQPEALRGPQFDAAWCDELAKWPRGAATWANLGLCLRLGEAPQALVTTTPRRTPLLKRLLAAEDTVVTRAPTEANAANLAPEFLEAMEREFGATSFARQELGGELLEDVEGALWTCALLEKQRVRQAPPLVRIVVAVDPATTSGKSADSCGIVVAGLCAEDGIYVLADLTVQGAAPLDWARRAVDAFHQWQADRIVAEVNQSGEMVEALVRQIDPDVSYAGVSASRGKLARAEPIAMAYERGQVRHVGAFPELEDEMCAFGPARDPREGSPDRVDALVWAVSELRRGVTQTPRVRQL
ncbi:terminase family protein [Albimonas sp. CAU 1670]|uniref:DNA-packaging protein n=1 Tax=Albimonas sp. CAU 1670 TaxID=3032599 RepID=UPI0023DB8D06|nr:terminase family protein [Albimonas sp. CAU 1670]MDF2232948.1 terminase family protein [Albimonas sp. CAU 1670]